MQYKASAVGKNMVKINENIYYVVQKWVASLVEIYIFFIWW